MSELPVPLAVETEALKTAYAALNRNDVPGVLDVLDQQIERIELFSGEVYRGLAAVAGHVSRARDTWAEGSCTPVQFIAAGDKIVVFVHVHVRLRHEVEWRDGHVTDVFTYRNGKAIEWRTFAQRQEALQWAGLDANRAG